MSTTSTTTAMLLAAITSATLVVPAVAAPAADHGADHDHVLPTRRADRVERAGWARAGGWVLAPRVAVSASAGASTTGSRVAAWVEIDGAAADLVIQARGVDGDRLGGWVALDQTYRGPAQRVVVADLGARWPAAELRVAGGSDAALTALSWELVEPAYPDAGRRARAGLGPVTPWAAPPVSSALDDELGTIGVITRATWGARATQCTSVENDWYRMAIHHTAGPQTSGGTTAEVVRGVQAYAQDSGTYCDIPYQFLVGFDGTLYEARPYGLTSGATGGGNNDGNMAVCFMGCYHPTDCPTGVDSVPVTEEMLARGQLLVQTLVRLHDIATADDNIRGHRDWPGNATACPGDFLYARLADLRADLAWYAGAPGARSSPAGQNVVVPVGVATEVWIEVENTGGLTWEPGVTFLAPTPRDAASPLAQPTWPGPTRAATVAAPVARGEVGRFAFTVLATAPGTTTQTFGLVADGATWFADPPWGGGPTDDAIAVTVEARDDGGGDPMPCTAGEPACDDVSAGCCQAAGVGRSLGGGLVLALAGLLGVRRRTRRLS